MELVSFYVGLSAVLFCLGAFGVVIRRNAIVIFMCIELMLNAVNINLVAFGHHYGAADTHVYVLLVMGVAAAEVAVGLAIIILVFRNFYSVNSSDVHTLQG